MTLERSIYYLLISVVVCALFANSIFNEFTYDDFPVILENRDVTSSDILGALRNGRGVRQLSFIIDYKMYGRNPAGYRLENIFIHAINSCLVYEFILLVPEAAIAAVPTALIFAAHPIHVEAVASIANRKDLLAFMFSMLATIFYIKGTNSSGRTRLHLISLAAIIFPLAVLSKENAAALPVALIFYDRIFLERKKQIISKIELPIFIIGIGLFYLLAVSNFAHFESILGIGEGSSKKTFMTAISTFPWNIKYLIFPFQLSADHIMPAIHTPTDLRLLLSLLALFLYFSTIIFLWFRSKISAFMLLWITVFLIPNSNIIPLTSYFFAERYLYLPSLGFCTMAGILLAKLPRRRVALASLLVILSIFSTLTVKRNTVWKTEETLWTDTIRKTPSSVVAHNNMGNIYYIAGNNIMAASEYERAIELHPRHVESLYNLGNIYFEQGEYEKARSTYRSFLDVWHGDEGIGMEVRNKILLMEKGIATSLNP